ncbi:MAG: DUF6492 family protein [Aestuariivirga sp.]
MLETQATSWAFVTPSYSGDLQRCNLLCRSMDAFLAGNWHHYVVVDRPHYSFFKHLAGPKRSILLTDDVMPANMRLLFHIPFVGGRSLWWSRQTGFSLGWLMQQMVKIGIASIVKEDGLAYCDSDIFFLRPFDTTGLTQEGRFRFYRTSARQKLEAIANPQLFNPCLDLLGLSKQAEYFTYIENLITWRRQTVLELCNHLAARHNGKWYNAFRNRVQVSEYNLYGLFVDEIQKDEKFHYHTSSPLCRTQWNKQQQSEADAAVVCASLEPGQVAVGFQSFLGIDVELLEQQFELALAHYDLQQ